MYMFPNLDLRYSYSERDRNVYVEWWSKLGRSDLTQLEPTNNVVAGGGGLFTQNLSCFSCPP